MTKQRSIKFSYQNIFKGGYKQFYLVPGLSFVIDNQYMDEDMTIWFKMYFIHLEFLWFRIGCEYQIEWKNKKYTKHLKDYETILEQ